MIVYKYLTAFIGNLVLTNCSIRFTQPAALNDPFEAFWLYEDAIPSETRRLIEERFSVEMGRVMTENDRLAIKAEIEREILNLNEEYSKEIGFLSLSKRKRHQFNVSHYANEHRGLVIGFDSKIFPEVAEVQYSATRPIYIQPKNRDAGLKQLIILLTTKSKYWEYEKEFRSIDLLKNRNSISGKDPKGYDICLYNFPVDSVKEVIFGWLTPIADREKIQKLVADKHPQAKLFEAKLSKSTFDLDIIPL